MQLLPTAKCFHATRPWLICRNGTQWRRVIPKHSSACTKSGAASRLWAWWADDGHLYAPLERDNAFNLDSAVEGKAKSKVQALRSTVRKINRGIRLQWSLRPSAGCSTSRYLSPEAVLKINTSSPGLIHPCCVNRRRAAIQAAASGQKNIPSARPTRGISANISSSLTLSAVPLLSRSARSIKKSATAWGTRRPEATV